MKLGIGLCVMAVSLGFMGSTAVVLAQAESEPAPISSAPPPDAAPQRLGGKGESCRAREDCQAALACLASTCQPEGLGDSCGATSECREPLVCLRQQCSDPNAPPPAPAPAYLPAYAAPGYGYPPAEVPPREPSAFEGNHFLAGVGLGAGPHWILSGYDIRLNSMMIDMKVGALLERHEFSLAYAPIIYMANGTTATAHTIRLETGNYFQLSDQVYWAIRASVGAAFGNSAAAFYGGIDLLNIGFAAGPALLELNLARLRMFSDFEVFDLGLHFGFTAHFVSL